MEQGVLSRNEADRIGADANSREGRVLAEYAEKGVGVVRLGNNRGYWSGLNDHELFDRVGKSDWYDYYYAPTSDAAHASVSALAVELNAAHEGRIEVGARPSDPTFVLVASMNMLGFAIAAIDQHFGLGQIDAVREARARADAATSEAIADDSVSVQGSGGRAQVGRGVE